MKSDEKIEWVLDAHLKQWEAIGEAVRIQMAFAVKRWEEMAKAVAQVAVQAAPSLKTQELIRTSVESITEAQRAMLEGVRPIIAEAIPWAKAFETIVTSHLEFMDVSYMKTLAGGLQNYLLSPASERLQESLNELPSQTQEAMLLLAEHGWYLDLEMSLPDLWEFRRAVSEGDVKEAENALADYFECRLDEIEKSILERFPQRAHVIRSAFKAHRQSEYELSIPVLLAQSDGMCKELIDQYLFIRKDKKPQTAIYVEQVASDTFRAALLSPLARTLPISASQHERAEDSSALNRHAVLHGESLDYGNKANGLKAISLLNYVAHVLGRESRFDIPPDLDA